MTSKRLGFATLTGSPADLYVVPVQTIARIEVIRISMGLAGDVSLRIENPLGQSNFLMNTTSIEANSSVELRDLILEAGWKIRGSCSAAGADVIISGIEANPAPTNPLFKVLGRNTLSASVQPIYTVPIGKTAVIKHLICANAGSSGELTIQYKTAGDVTKNYRNQETFPARAVYENFDIPLNEAGDQILASGSGDIVIFGLEFNAT